MPPNVLISLYLQSSPNTRTFSNSYPCSLRLKNKLLSENVIAIKLVSYFKNAERKISEYNFLKNFDVFVF